MEADRIQRTRSGQPPPIDPSIHADTLAEQAAVDRARAQARNSMRRAMAELEKLRATRSDRDISQIGAEEEKLQNEPNSDNQIDLEKLQNEPKPVAPSPSSRPRDTSALPCPCGSGFNTFTCTYFNHERRHPGLPSQTVAEPNANAD